MHSQCTLQGKLRLAQVQYHDEEGCLNVHCIYGFRIVKSSLLEVGFHRWATSKTSSSLIFLGDLEHPGFILHILYLISFYFLPHWLSALSLIKLFPFLTLHRHTQWRWWSNRPCTGEKEHLYIQFSWRWIPIYWLSDLIFLFYFSAYHFPNCKRETNKQISEGWHEG